MDFIKSHPKIYTYLDNDEAGKKATQLLRKSCPNLSDQSVHYSKHKDLNELLKSWRLKAPKKNIKPFKPRLRM